MKKHSPAKTNAEYAALVQKDNELRKLIASLTDTVREGGAFAESAAEQIKQEQAEAQEVTIALAHTRTRYNDMFETTEVIPDAEGRA